MGVFSKDASDGSEGSEGKEGTSDNIARIDIEDHEIFQKMNVMYSGDKSSYNPMQIFNL